MVAGRRLNSHRTSASSGPPAGPGSLATLRALPEVFQYTRHALELVWSTSRPLTVALALLTLVAGVLPAGIAYLGALIVDAVVDKVALRRGTADVARAYLEHLYSKEGQEIVAKHYYRPRDPEVAAKYANVFPKVNLVTIADFGGWDAAQKKHFADGAIFDQITRR